MVEVDVMVSSMCRAQMRSTYAINSMDLVESLAHEVVLGHTASSGTPRRVYPFGRVPPW